MSLLKAEPSAPVRSLEELFALAHAMEQEAAERYAEIARRMREEGNPGLAAVFDGLSADETGHLDQVVRWSRHVKGQAPDPSLIRWKPPETFDDEGASTIAPELLSAYRALAMAVRNEERAFAFWSYVAAQAQDAPIQQAAEAMAREELGHVATLRRERRRAFHAARAGAGGDGEVAGDEAALERRLADLFERLAAQAPADEQTRLTAYAQEARRHALELEAAPIRTPAASHLRAAATSPVALAELLTERYLEVADGQRDEAELVRLQALAGRAVARLVWLRADLPELDGIGKR
ncbi:ferritin family protein [Bosea sp. CS1GBMeth4]|uniref:ferritin family protein n=1 Tax=Bosea sp. CS1GBMeth4 TaxID=1892849 RepID=UPI001648387B|nr:ferritin family protein [Bosea sp. CS1GBMeth4]